MTRDELIAKLEADNAIQSYLDPDEIAEGCDEAIQETGWAFPVVGGFKELWIKRRAERNCFWKLWTQSARKFKVEQLNLNQRFTHYGEVIKKMDADFEKAIEENPAEFTTAETYKAFGTVAGPGFVYDITGKDVTKLIP